MTADLCGAARLLRSGGIWELEGIYLGAVEGV